MPFGLKNVRATYQKLVNQMFNKQIGRNIEIYVNDIVDTAFCTHYDSGPCSLTTLEI